MELFATTGFEIGDKVFTLLDDKSRRSCSR
jgi:hypothetical protein